MKRALGDKIKITLGINTDEEKIEEQTQIR